MGLVENLYLNEHRCSPDVTDETSVRVVIPTEFQHCSINVVYHKLYLDLLDLIPVLPRFQVLPISPFQHRVKSKI